MSTYIHDLLLDAIILPCHYFNGGPAKLTIHPTVKLDVKP